MATATNRAEFIEACLRKLGKPVIEINVSPDQIDDRVDEALKFWHEYHFDGMSKTYYKHQIDANDKINEYISLPENLKGVVRMFDLAGGSAAMGSGMFNTQYQMTMDMYAQGGSNYNISAYWNMMEQMQFMQYIVSGKQPIRFNRHTDRCYLDLNWENLNVGDYIILEGYSTIDPDEYTDAWSDRWLSKYCTALIKKQWGQNLIKFDGIQMPGGITFNGRQLYDDADGELSALEQEMLISYSLPPEDFIG